MRLAGIGGRGGNTGKGSWDAQPITSDVAANDKITYDIDMRLIDLTGLRFGRLVASHYNRNGGKPYWHCICDCGAQCHVEPGNLRSGHTRSCGCLNIEKRFISTLTHGMTGTSTHYVWGGMLSRCYNPKNPAYENYGGRGIAVCESWRNNFEAFLADMRERPRDMTLERRENDKGYSPENCEWASRTAQARNTRRNVFYEFNGERMLLGQWAKRLSISEVTLRKRMKAGQSFEVAARIGTAGNGDGKETATPANAALASDKP